MKKGEGEAMYICTVIEPLNCDSFNLVYKLKFSDGDKLVMRIPAPGEQGCFTPSSSRILRSDAMTMSFLHQNTLIPIPQIFSFDETIDNEIGALYILMAFGSPSFGNVVQHHGPNTTRGAAPADPGHRVYHHVPTEQISIRQDQLASILTLTPTTRTNPDFPKNWTVQYILQLF